MKKIVHIVLISCCFTSVVATSVVMAEKISAATATKSATLKASPSPSPTPPPDQQANQEIKKRIEKITVNGKVQGVMSNALSEKAGFIGEVSRLSQESLTVKQGNNTTIVPFTDSLTILEKDKKISPDDIEVGNWVIVVGSKTNDKISPEFILVNQTSLQPKPKFIGIGTITNITRSKVTVLPRGTTAEQALTVTKTSKFENDDNSVLKVTDFQKDLSVIVIGIKNDDDSFNLTTLHALTDIKVSK